MEALSQRVVGGHVPSHVPSHVCRRVNAGNSKCGVEVGIRRWVAKQKKSAPPAHRVVASVRDIVADIDVNVLRWQRW